MRAFGTRLCLMPGARHDEHSRQNRPASLLGMRSCRRSLPSKHRQTHVCSSKQNCAYHINIGFILQCLGDRFLRPHLDGDAPTYADAIESSQRGRALISLCIVDIKKNLSRNVSRVIFFFFEIKRGLRLLDPWCVHRDDNWEATI